MKLRLNQTHAAPLLRIMADTGEVPVEDVRSRLSKAFKAGELDRLAFSATVWTNGRNKNHYQFPDAELEAFATSFVGSPFLRDHEASMSARGGTIRESWLEAGENGERAIRQRIEAVKPWAIEGVLDGTIDRFSVGWDATDYLCTVCEKDITECGHLSKIGRIDKESGKKVELLWKGLEGVETSAVTHPAAPGTTTEEVMSQLATMAEHRKHASGNPAGAIESEEQMLEKILSALGLPAGTTEAQALSAVEALKAIPKAATKSVLAMLGLGEGSTEADVIGKLGALTAPGVMVPRAEHQRVVDELSGMKTSAAIAAAKSAGKITPAMEEWAKGFAKDHGLAALESALTNMPTQAPLGTPPPATDGNVPKGNAGLTVDELAAAAVMGKTPEQFAKDKAEVLEFERTGTLPKASA